METKGSRSNFSRSLNLFLESITDKVQKNLVDVLVIRLMSKAKYTTNNNGHFGLAFHSYTHFTSPIRRYSDILVHRLLTRYLNSETNAQRCKYEKLCWHCSAMELLAKAAERDSVRYKLAEFMQEKESDLFTGVVLDVSTWGLLVELNGIRCEGVVPIHSLGNEYFDLDENNFTLTGRKTKRCFRLGDLITVQVMRVDMEQKEIYLTLVEKK